MRGADLVRPPAATARPDARLAGVRHEVPRRRWVEPGPCAERDHGARNVADIHRRQPGCPECRWVGGPAVPRVRRVRGVVHHHDPGAHDRRRHRRQADATRALERRSRRHGSGADGRRGAHVAAQRRAAATHRVDLAAGAPSRQARREPHGHGAGRRRVADHDRCVPDRRVGAAEGARGGQSGVAVGRRGDHRQPGDPGCGDRCADRRPTDRLLPGHLRGQAAPAERDRQRPQ